MSPSLPSKQLASLEAEVQSRTADAGMAKEKAGSGYWLVILCFQKKTK